MNNSEHKKTTPKEQTKDTFLKKIKALDASEQELLLKLYSEIIKEMK